MVSCEVSPRCAVDTDVLRDRVRPEETALLIIDMQRDYCCKGGVFDRRGFDVAPAGGLATALNEFVKSVRGVLKHIVHLKMTKVEGLSSPPAEDLYRRLGFERRPDPSFAEFHEVLPLEGDMVIPKYTYSGFVSTFLDRFLRLNGVKTLVVTGLATNVCVESTVRDAFTLGYHAIVPSDLTEGTSPEAKRASLSNIDAFFGQVVDSDRLLRCWQIKD